MALLLVTFVITGCATKGIAKVDPCLGFSPIMVSRYDVLTDTTAREIDIHNRYGEKMCHWSAK